MRSRWSNCLLLVAFLGGIALLRVHSSDDKKLSIYAPQIFYSLPVTQHDNKDYVQLFALMEPLGKTTLRIDGHTFHLRVNEVEGEFKDGKSSIKIGKTKIEMDGDLMVESGQAAVPLSAVTRILSEYLRRPVEFHETARRIFLDNAATQFNAELKKSDPSSFVLSFSAPVNPSIHSEGNKLQLVFNREPVLAGTGSNPLNDKLFTSSTFQEGNGAAELTIAGTAPLMASFADGGKTITITSAPAPAAAAAVPATTTASAPAQQTTPTAPPRFIMPGPPRFFVMIDPGHGGDDPGAKFSDTLLEKDITLAFARKLRVELQSRGVPAVLTRDSDTTLTFDQRAVSTNSQRAAIYVAVHAGVPGSGVRVMSAMLPSTLPGDEGTSGKTSPFLPWETAQSAHLEKSRILAGAIVQEFAEKNTHAISSTSPLRPLNSIACVAVGIEIASRDPQALVSPKLQQSLAASVAAGIVNGRARLDTNREELP